jgi:hypothetical protein
MCPFAHAPQSSMPNAPFAREQRRLDADSVVANANSRRQRLYGSFGGTPAKPCEGLDARRYESGKRMQSKRSIVRLIIKKL